MFFINLFSIHIILCLGSVLKADEKAIVKPLSFSGSENVGSELLEELHFTAFGRVFELVLHPLTKAKTLKHILNRGIDSENSNGQLYEGTVSGYPKSLVRLSDSAGQYFGTIDVDGKFFIFEPAFLTHSKADKGDIALTMKVVSNRPASPDDVALRGRRLSLESHLTNTDSADERYLNNRCLVSIIVDYLVLANMNHSVSQVYSYIISLIEKVNEIFEKTDFDFDLSDTDLVNRGRKRYVGMGMQIKNVVVLEKNLTDPYSFTYSGPRSWDMEDLLNNFVVSHYCEDTCICHLVTGKNIIDEKKELKLGIGSNARIGEGKGICSTYNGVVTRAVFSDVHVTKLKQYLVVAHEYAHVWGASHDNDGNYLMRTLQVDGDERSHYSFSNESKTRMRKTLESNGDCFVRPNINTCGNSVVEKNEQCDGGKTDSKCCSSNCLLHKGALCSPENFPCCRDNCTFSDKTHKCFSSIPEDCLDDGFCTGYSGLCPERYLTDTPCYGNGTCKNGECRSYCNTLGKTDCLCKEDSCRRCCRDKKGSCTVEEGLFLPELERCGENRICRNKQCVTTTNRGLRGSPLLEWALPVIVAIATIVTVACSYLVYIYDVKQLKQREKRLNGKSIPGLSFSGNKPLPTTFNFPSSPPTDRTSIDVYSESTPHDPINFIR